VVGRFSGQAGSLQRSLAPVIQSYRDLEAWQIVEFVVRVYALTKSFPHEEIYGLTSQLRRAAVAVPSNVSEGHQHGTKSYLHFVTLALGSLAEAQTQLEIARRLTLAPDAELDVLITLATRARQVLLGLRRSLAARTVNR
jgi:four helix bundle protein